MEDIDLGSNYLRATRGEGCLRVTLDRPHRRNACTMAMYNGLRRAANLAENDPAIDCLVIAGSGENFCVGGDMGDDQQERGLDLANEAEPLDLIPFASLERCSKIVISAVNGICHAGGCDIVLCSDFAIASERATFRVPELLRGLADGWLGARLPERIGMARAKYLIFTGASIDAHEAERIGLVAKVVPHAQLGAEVEAAIAGVRGCAPAARAALKKQMNSQLPPFDVGIFARSLRHPEMREGFRAFLEKRAPDWPREA